MNEGFTSLSAQIDSRAVGAEMHGLMAELMPIPRSLTGNGVRQTLARIGEDIELTLHEVPSGTPVFDWAMPDEWNLRDAWVQGPGGRRVVDLADSTLHVVGYSEPIARRMPLAELKEHVHSLPEHPEWVPYRTSYWERTWGLCMSHNALSALPEGEYEVVIDATLAPGSLTYGEILIPGESDRAVVVSTPVCHPALANDNLSGIVLLARLGVELARADRLRRTHHLLLGPGTLGSLAWLAENESLLDRIDGGLAVMCVGDPAGFTYKRSRVGDARIDRAMALALRDCGVPHTTTDFVPWGGDERQFGSPGFNLPVGAFSRTPPGAFEENHTSADDLDYVRPDALGESLKVAMAALEGLECDRRYLSTSPKGEPQLGRRGLTRRLGGQKGGSWEMALFWNLNLADGEHGLLDVADRSGLPLIEVVEAAQALEQSGLLTLADESD